MFTFSLRYRPKKAPRSSVFRDHRGLVASEYALLAAGIVVIAGGATIAFRSNLLTTFANIGTQILATADRLAGGTGTATATRTSDAAQDDGGRRRIYDEHTLRRQD
ncbi:Flp family type IVb pilin [Neoroseomonas rubea]|uniref:Flp family type IVb pilin n=1 Tax=Neoroseomonas rubea TaxID=2748666 RepID=UPI0018DF36B2|nr:Flp family type IVb pilin [Roseomonas rubea]